ncbi:MAG: tRNA guanosine(15) transglycosylase TgtA [Candidatus Lokiarchaeota archaeon]|nr:tRNA guanosine(15) transglycosylase TgtA [Candidatus Lokiarchaeota archaeon]
MKFEIQDVDALGRIGKIEVNNKQMITPNLFPVIHPFDNVITASGLKDLGAQCLFTNAYIMYKNKEYREEILNKGIHDFLNYDGIIATDSGAFQQYMYNDNKIEISPEEIENFQERIESDFPVILDLPVQLEDTFEVAESKVLKTIERAKENISRRENQNCYWIGPIHGGKFPDLLKRSSIEMSKLDFGIYAIGGLVKAFLQYQFELTLNMLITVKKNIIPNKPLHMFGLGLPQFFSLAVACGCDLMDSAAYILFAKQNRYFTLSTGTKRLDELIEFPCHCPICTKYTPSEVKTFEPELIVELLAKHNLYLSFSELRTIRQAIRDGNLWELVETRIRNHPNLVNAYRMIKNHDNFFELHEKAYKNHGRLYSSVESVNRPLFRRYSNKLDTNYRVPKEVKFLIILPELDVKGVYSPQIQKWIEIINNNANREKIHIILASSYYGVIPNELMESFPLGQHEGRMEFKHQDHAYNALSNTKLFFEKNHDHYVKIAILLPNEYLNELNEKTDISKNNVIFIIKDYLTNKFKEKGSTFLDIESVLEYFNDGLK